MRADRFYQRRCICVLTTALQHRCAVCLIVLNSRWGIDARVRSSLWHHRASQRVSQDPDIPAIQCGILLSSSQRTMIRRRLYAHEKRVTIF
jgi:hypothetical protein